MDPTKEPAPGVLFALPPPDMSVLNSTLGAILISGIVTSVLYGISCLQCFIFFQHSARKKFRILTYSIWAIWLLDTAHLAVLVSYTLYWYMVKNFSNVLALLELPWSVSGGLIITTVSDGIVRFWFTYRVWILSNNNKWLTIPLLVLNINLLGVALASGIKGLFLHTLAQFLELSWLLYYGFGLIIVTDFYIAISLCFFLYRSRRDTISHKTESMLNLLMIYTINTGLLTSIVSLLTLIMYVSHPHDYEFIAMYFILEKLYVNSLLASLNARDWLNGDSGVVSIPLSLLGTSDTQPSQVNHQTEALDLEASLTSIASGVRVRMEKAKAVI